MIAVEFDSLLKTSGKRTAISRGEALWTYDRLAAAGARIAARLEDLCGQNVGVCTAEPALQLAIFLALDRIDATAVVYPASSSPDAVRDDDLAVPLAEIIHDGAGSRGDLRRELDSDDCAALPFGGPSRGRVVLFTSGTAGRPKPALHTWNSLAAAVSRQAKHAARHWLLSYDISRFAGLQVMLQALLTGGRLCVPVSREPEAVLRCLIEDRVQCASATPTFWRMLLGAATANELRQCVLERITLGGEATDQAILDDLNTAFPAARICHIYASTEMGTCFTVRDGMAGFPISYLSDKSLPCRLRIGDDGELLIQSARAMHEYLGGVADDNQGWFATGDIARVEGDRVFFLGRKGECINVGGAKVYPADVELVIRTVPGVRHVCVHRLKSSLVGELVAADIEPADAADEADLRRQILDACRQRLAKHQVPAQITFQTQLTINASGKLARTDG